jgi:hypothetical protein
LGADKYPRFEPLRLRLRLPVVLAILAHRAIGALLIFLTRPTRGLAMATSFSNKKALRFRYHPEYGQIRFVQQ